MDSWRSAERVVPYLAGRPLQVRARPRRPAAVASRRSARVFLARSPGPARRLLRPAGALALALVLVALVAPVAGASTIMAPPGVVPRRAVPATGPGSRSAVAPAGRTGQTGGGGGPSQPGVARDGKSGTSKGAKAKHPKPVKVFVEPPAVVDALLASVSSDEHQLLALHVYGDALGYLRVAEAVTRKATSVLARDVALLGQAKAAEARAVAVEVAAVGRVRLFRSSLYELGIAEYTGQVATTGTDLAAQEREIYFSQLARVAAGDEGEGLQEAVVALHLAEEHVQAARALVAVRSASTSKARLVLASADAQLSRSEKAALAARTWATVPGQAPAQPARELVLLEAAPGAKAHAQDGKASLVAGDLQAPAQAQGVAARGAPPTTGTAASGSGTKVAGPPAQGEAAGGPGILGAPALAASEIAGWFASTGSPANATVPIATLARYYLEEGKLTGVRGDVAFAQSVVETGYFSFPSRGQDPASYNNFAGIGACDHCKHGWKFPSARTGVLYQESLLAEYATPPSPYGPPGGLAAGLGVAGCCRTWVALSGVWASNPNYGYDILFIYKEMLDWGVQHEMAVTGLAPAWASSPRILRGGA